MINRKTLWISHSAISDFGKCKRAYYYKHLYRNPKSNNRIQVVSPYLSLGTAVHETIEKLSSYPVKKRKELSLIERYDEIWEDCRGKKGGFISEEQEKEFKERGEEMVKKAESSKLLSSPALDTNNTFPKLSLFENIELVGSIDWIEILSTGELHIIDFKTGKNEENSNSLQLPIYLILARKNFDKNIKRASYWYLNNEDEPALRDTGHLEEHLERIKKIALQISEAVKERDFSCSSGYKSCFHCREFDSVFSGSAEYVGFDERMKKELYYPVKENNVLKRVSGGSFLNGTEKEIFEMRTSGKKAPEIGKALNLSSEKVGEEMDKIKEKLKENLSSKELRVFIKKMNA